MGKGEREGEAWAVRLEEALVRGPARKWEKRGTRRLPEAKARALLFYHLGDKSSTDSQLIFNAVQTTRPSTSE